MYSANARAKAAFGAGVVFLLLAVAGGLLLAQSPGGPRVETFRSEVDGTDQPYALYVPPGYEPARRYPLVVMLHAAASNHRVDLRRLFGVGPLPGETEREASRVFPRFPEAQYFAVVPLARGSMGYLGVAEKDVYDAIEDVRKRHPIDEDRIYLSGIDMGGGGALWLAMTNPGMWAGVAPLAPEPPEGAVELAGNLLNVPIALHQGELDPLVPARSTRTWHKVLLDLGVQAEYSEYPALRHNAWDPAYRGLAAFRWFDSLRRNRSPERVRFATRGYRYASAYWVRIDRLSTPGDLASLDARFTARNRVEVRTNGGIDAFTLNIADHPLRQPAGGPVVVVVDGVTLRPRANEASFHRAGTAWRTGRVLPAAGEKRPGLEGPIAEAVAGRHAYVYGTLGAAGDEGIAPRRAVAEAAAEWSSARQKLLLSPPVVPDGQAPAGTWPLVVFGTRETNRALADARLPLELNAGAADYGLLYVYPSNGRLLLVNSGVPWFAAGGLAAAGGRSYLPERYHALTRLPDFVLFRGSLDNIVVAGRFDRQWRLTPADAAALKATGMVVINQ